MCPCFFTNGLKRKATFRESLIRFVSLENCKLKRERHKIKRGKRKKEEVYCHLTCTKRAFHTVKIRCNCHREVLCRYIAFTVNLYFFLNSGWGSFKSTLGSDKTWQSGLPSHEIRRRWFLKRYFHFFLKNV
jgi:hypothetical protein